MNTQQLFLFEYAVFQLTYNTHPENKQRVHYGTLYMPEAGFDPPLAKTVCVDP